MCWQRSLRVEALLQILQTKRFYYRMNIQKSLNLYHKQKGFSLELNMNCCYMFFKGSNFYLQIIHWYDFIQAWTDVRHLFNVSLENFPHGEHLYGIINRETLKFFQECSSTTLNLYHKHKRLNSSKYELSLGLLTVESISQTQNKRDTKVLFLIKYSCFIRIHKVNSSKSLTVESLSQTQNKRDKKVLFLIEYSRVLSESTRWTLQNMNGLQICWQWSLTVESLSQTQKGHFSLEWMFIKHELLLHVF